MSKASKVGQVHFSRKGGLYMARIQSDKGDLYQEYQGKPEAPTSIVPDFGSLKPILSYVITSSRVSEGTVTPNKVQWFFDDTELTFGSDGKSTNLFNGEKGHFTNLPASAGTRSYYSIQITKNLVKATGAAPCTIKAVATIAVGNTSDKIQATYSIPITVGKSNAIRVTIAAGSPNAFIIDNTHESCVLEAIVRSGNDLVTSGLTYEWFEIKAGTWSKIAGQGNKTLTVTKDMVATNGQFKVSVKQNGTLLGTDVETVTDATDVYDMLLNPNPADETIEEGSGGTVTYSPIVIKRGSTANAFPGMKFFFTFMDSAGNILNSSTSKTAATTGTVKEDMCVQADGDVSYVITSEK